MTNADPNATHRLQLSADDSATVDLGRPLRCGLGEAIYGEGKSAALIAAVARSQSDAGQHVLATRVTPQIASELIRQFPTAIHDTTARTVRIMATQTHQEDAEPDCDTPHVAVITAGSTDAAVAAEAMETLHWAQVPLRQYTDIGVAGPQRLLERVVEIRCASAVIVIAGMEGALPSVVAGHVAVPVIAVPTSVGYGANLEGITPLLSALASCAPGVTTVGIDAGFKAGYVAALMLRSANQRSAAQPASANRQRVPDGASR
ncbi:MAG: nickel pincer cofactor biosynthesis protein LarB [Planctomycetota bacterium]